MEIGLEGSLLGVLRVTATPFRTTGLRTFHWALAKHGDFFSAFALLLFANLNHSQSLLKRIVQGKYKFVNFLLSK
jgi:hypothetical protein